jgi:hypothetical protein
MATNHRSTQSQEDQMKLTTAKIATGLGIAALGIGGVSTAQASSTTSSTQIGFALQRSAASIAANCLPNAKATVQVTHKGQVEEMVINAQGLPKNTDFDVFVTQLPNAPFGISWYQGDLQSNDLGQAHVKFVGRFSVETFAVAPGVGPAPVVHNSGPIQDAATNPAFAPVHTYHVGVWFNSGTDAGNAGCANVVTPFNGDHTAGPQALSTKQFADTNGPLRRLVP